MRTYTYKTMLLSLLFLILACACALASGVTPCPDGSHTWVETTTPATCKDPEKLIKTCSVCGVKNEYTKGEPNNNHSYGAYVTTREPTCKREGEQTATCSVCGKKNSLPIEKTEHSYGEWQQHDDQWHIRYCKVCQWAYKGSHRLDNGKVLTKATSSSLGEVVYTCRVCQYEMKRSIGADGTVYSQTGTDVLGNGVKYLLVEATEIKDDKPREVKLPDGSILEISALEGCEISVFANAETGAYAGLYVQSGEADVTVMPSADTDTLKMEFIKINAGASINMRIWNMTGEIAIAGTGEDGVVISQHKNDDGSCTTGFMRTKKTKNKVEGTALFATSSDGIIKLTSTKNELKAALNKEAQPFGSVSWNYDAKTNKVTMSARDKNNKYNGIGYYAFINDVIIVGSRDKASITGTVKTAEKNPVWRLRAAFPTGEVFHSPKYNLDGTLSVLADGSMYMTSEELEKLQKNEAQALTQEPAQAPTQAPTQEPTQEPTQAPPTVSPAEPKKDEYETIDPFGSHTFSGDEGISYEAEYADSTYTISVSKLPEGCVFSGIRLIQSFESGFSIKNSSSQNASFEVECRESRVKCVVTVKDKSGKTHDINAGAFRLTFK